MLEMPGFQATLQPLNRVVAPLIKLGFGSPWLFTAGFVVLEIPGRKTGRRYTVPLVGWFAPGRLIVATVRSESQWVRNLAAIEEVKLWVCGRETLATPTILLDGQASGATRADEPMAAPANLSDKLGVTLVELRL